MYCPIVQGCERRRLELQFRERGLELRDEKMRWEEYTVETFFAKSKEHCSFETLATCRGVRAVRSTILGAWRGVQHRKTTDVV